ncbi:protein ARK2N isoform X3 [Amia ocellicauda]|uniref:protein ARK2N isoform X3 n=1 Tax=Amia ocellicauda TaxID=2972642 RepID=UPI003463B6CE
MKMADTEKTEELVDSETPPEAPADRPAAGGGAVAREDEPLKTETSPSEKEGDSPLQTDPSLMSSMPCLLMELRRDSPESQRASTESEKPPSNRTYESDSSNPCLLSPSSSGHLADSDTLSSGEEAAAGARGAGGGAAEGAEPGLGAGGPAAVGGRKSRRSRSESEMSSAAMAAKKNRWQAVGGDKHNGRLAKVKGQRSQKHKQRMRLLRQKREAAARKKYNLLQDSSTSDSDLTCDSSSSSSDDDDEVSGSSKTITADIPGHIEAQFGPGDQQTCGPLQIKEEINIASTDSEVEIVGVQENTRCVHPRGGVIQSLSSWKHGAVVQYSSARQSHLWTAVSPQPSWASPPEVVDLTLDEDARRKYLL